MDEIIDTAYIKVQDLNGGWFIARTAFNVNYQYLIMEMKLVQGMYPSLRVKATNKSGALIDIL